MKMEKKEIVFITEGSSMLGLGHLMRCIAIAEQARDLNLKPVFIVNNDSAASVVLKKYRFDFRRISDIKEGITKYIGYIKNNPVLIDSKKDVSGVINRLKRNGCKVSLLDNMTNARLYADKVIYPGAHYNPDSLNWEGKETKLHYGVKLFPLRKEIINTKCRKRKDYILVSMGGADPNNLTKLVLDSIDGNLRDIKLITVVTKAYRYKRWLKQYKVSYKTGCNIIENLKLFPSLLSCARMVVTALGVTIYEAAYSRTPALVINNYTSDFQDSVMLQRLGLCRSLGYYKDLTPNDILRNVKIMYFSKAKADAKDSRPDGNGARRILKLVLN